jgi:hypothetical protein
MDTLPLKTAEALKSLNAARLAKLAPRPLRAAETGLTPTFLEELLAKHLYDGSVLELGDFVRRTALAGGIVEEILTRMRADAYVEVRGQGRSGASLRFALTDRGRALALKALAQSGYVGPAPVPLEQYTAVVHAQSVHQHGVTKARMQAAFSEVVIREDLLDELGPALHSGRAIFVYGPAGTGKTFISQRLASLLGDPVLIPYAIAIDDAVVQLFDPALHRPIDGQIPTPDLLLEEGFDPRFVLCERPAVVTGGELTLEMLEIQYDAVTRLHQAPLQLKATNGLYLVDDLGRQRVATRDLLNRWIVPMESRQDYLSLASGKRFQIPFDVVLIFSTNLNPRDLADEAFLRRLGHKIRFGPLQPQEYEAIWHQVCQERGIAFDFEVFRYVLEELHGKRRVPLLACHPRDLIGIATDHARYQGTTDRLSIDLLNVAWRNYFVSLAADTANA